MTSFHDAPIHDVVVRELKPYNDSRGWLTEIFRHDEVAETFHPAMAYVSLSHPGVTRGPHEHVDQADYFAFIGPSTFRLVLWDNRADSPSYRHRMCIEAGQGAPHAVIVPAGVVHGYKNVGDCDGLVINCPNRLFMGPGRTEPIDEIRHERDPETPFKMEY